MVGQGLSSAWLSTIGQVRGQIIVQPEEVQESKFTVQMQLSASKLDKKDLFGKVYMVLISVNSLIGAY